MPNHPPIRVIEVDMYDGPNINVAFKMTFFDLTKKEIFEHDEDGRTHIHRALRRRGWEGLFFPGEVREITRYGRHI